MFAPPKQVPAPKIVRKVQDNWLKGYQSTLDDDRKDIDGLKTTTNVVIEQNGTVRPRPSLVLYGTQPTGTVLGQVYPFIKMNGTTPENYEICMQNVSGTTQPYVRKDGGAWTVCTGKTYDNSARAHFEQINDKILISNGVDYLSYLNISTLTVIPMTALSATTGGAVASGGSTSLAGTTYNWRFRVTATGASGGETAGSTAATMQLTKIRDQWTGGAAEYLNYTWNRVSGATRYHLYVGDQAGFEYYLDTVSDIGSGATQTYRDDGSVALNSNRLAPNDDSTAGPKVTRTTNVLGQIHMDGDTDHPYRHWFGGFGDAALDFSAFNGGGWVEIDKGGKYFPVVSKGFRTGKGDPAVTIMMKGTSGSGKLVHGIAATETLGDTIISYMDLQEANGQVGTDAPDAVIYARDSLWYPSRGGFSNTKSKPQIPNILTTDPFSQSIAPDVKNLNVKNMEKAVGVEFDGRLYFALPVGSTTNNQIWVSDLNRSGIWTNPWNISADWLWVSDDNTGFTRHMVLSNNKIYELSYAQLTKDEATAFPTTIGSGIQKFSDDGMEWGSVIDITFVILRPQGPLSFSVTGKTADEAIAPVASSTFTPETAVAGWNEAAWNVNYWNEVVAIPTSFGEARETYTLEINEELNWLTWQVSSVDSGVDYQLSEVVIRYVNIGVIDID